MTDLLTRCHAWESGSTLYLTTPVTAARPSAEQVDEFAFASAVKSMAPNENIGWLQGRYVESGKANLNGAMWLSDELALKALTPQLMPVTVMHDPRTAVGTIADCKLLDGDRARIDTILGIWKHRFPDVWEEAEANIKDGTMMQSMECQAPWYSCSECGQSFVKLAEGKERASWCAHLQDNSSCRILGDVCFTGTGLIFGTRGGQGAYTEAHLDHFRDEIAEFHARAHVDGRYTPREEPRHMGIVQIEQSELDLLRKERDDARTERDEKASEARELTTKVEKAEADLTKAADEKSEAIKERDALKGETEAARLKSSRWDSLGDGFKAKLGDTTKSRLQEQAGSMSDEDWTARLEEVEEMLGVKRDAKAEGGSSGEGASTEDNGTKDESGSAFSDEELANFATKRVTAPAQAGSGTGLAARSLARAFKPERPKATAGKTD